MEKTVLKRTCTLFSSYVAVSLQFFGMIAIIVGLIAMWKVSVWLSNPVRTWKKGLDKAQWVLDGQGDHAHNDLKWISEMHERVNVFPHTEAICLRAWYLTGFLRTHCKWLPHGARLRRCNLRTEIRAFTSGKLYIGNHTQSAIYSFDHMNLSSTWSLPWCDRNISAASVYETFSVAALVCCSPWKFQWEVPCPGWKPNLHPPSCHTMVKHQHRLM